MKIVIVTNVVVYRKTKSNIRPFNNIELLLVKRCDTDDHYPSYYAFPGGEADLTIENIEDSVHRELKEETNIVLDSPLILVHTNNVRISENFTAVGIYYLAEYNKDDLPVAGDEISDVVWMNINEVRKLDLAFQHNEILEKIEKNVL